MSELGYLEGEICNRDGCEEPISLKEVEGGCSCHINPPCTYCMTPREHCTECGWDAQEEQEAEEHAAWLRRQARPEEEKRAERRYWELERIKRLVKTFDPKRINSKILPHTHFTQIVEGWFPSEMSREDVRKQMDGTFGGRFEYFSEKSQTFRFIAYTD